MEKGFTKVPNILLNSILKRRFTVVELKLIMTIIRYTSGFMRNSAELSISMLAKEIGSDRTVVSRHITRLINMGVVKVLSTNPYTKVRTLMINDDVEKWGDQVTDGVDRSVNRGVDQAVNRGVDQAVNRGVDQAVNRGVDQAVNYVYTVRSTNKDNINIILFKNIKERVDLTPNLEKAITAWLDYKTERKEVYGKIPLSALINTVIDKTNIWGEEAVIEVINDCIACGYKNIVWEKLKIRRVKNNTDQESAFLNSYDHAELEKISRGKNYD